MVSNITCNPRYELERDRSMRHKLTYIRRGDRRSTERDRCTESYLLGCHRSRSRKAVHVQLECLWYRWCVKSDSIAQR